MADEEITKINAKAGEVIQDGHRGKYLGPTTFDAS
jgi:hypothetical protein